MKKPTFSKKEAISYGYETTKKNFWFLVVVFIIVLVVSGIASSLSKDDSVLGSLISFVVNLILEMGIIRIAIELVNNKKPQFKDLFYIKPFFTYFVVSIVEAIAVSIGFILLIIPGILLAIKLQYSSYLVVDKNYGIMEALRGSWQMTKGIKWNLFLLGLLFLLINIAGLIALVIGLFFTVPLALLANTFVYKKLLSQSKLK